MIWWERDGPNPSHYHAWWKMKWLCPKVKADPAFATLVDDLRPISLLKTTTQKIWMGIIVIVGRIVTIILWLGIG